MSAAFYFMACLSCGLQLCFGIFHPNQSDNVILSRLVGGILLGFSISALCYILGVTSAELRLLWDVGTAIDYVIFTFFVCVGYVIVTNNQPSVRILIVLALPFIVLALLHFRIPSWQDYFRLLAVLVMISEYLYYGIRIRHHERLLEDLYSNQKKHSLKWIRGIIALIVGWLVICLIFRLPGLKIWQNAAAYIYMTGFVLFAAVKVSKYGKPVRRETQEQIEDLGGVEWCGAGMSSESDSSMQAEFLRLLQDGRVYLNPDLTVEDVASRLNTMPRNLSAMLHNDMHISFCRLINEKRIEYAKELLRSSDDKVEQVGLLCGFNSYTSFYRTFLKITGQTPSEWRNH